MLTMPVKQSTVLAGIDIGFTGGIAKFHLACAGFECDLQRIELHPMPTKKEGSGKVILDLVKLKTLIADVESVTIENVHPRPKEGVSSVFRFGWQKGAIEGILTVLDIPYIFISPRVWKKGLTEVGLCEFDKASSRRDHKNFAVECVNRHFAKYLVNTGVGKGLKKTEDGLADALLIGWWGIIGELGLKVKTL